MAKVMFRSALPPRSSGLVTSNPCGAWLAPADGADARDEPKPVREQDEDEDGGKEPERLLHQLGADDALQELVAGTPPAIPRSSARRTGQAASCAWHTGPSTIRPTATIQVTTIEFVMKKFPVGPIPRAFGVSPCPSCFGAADGEAFSADVAVPAASAENPSPGAPSNSTHSTMILTTRIPDTTCGRGHSVPAVLRPAICPEPGDSALYTRHLQVLFWRNGSHGVAWRIWVPKRVCVTASCNSSLALRLQRGPARLPSCTVETPLSHL